MHRKKIKENSRQTGISASLYPPTAEKGSRDYRDFFLFAHLNSQIFLQGIICVIGNKGRKEGGRGKKKGERMIL